MKETERGFISKAAMFPVHFPRLPSQRYQNSEQISHEGKLVSIFKGSNLVGGTPGAQDRVKQVFPSGRQDPKNMHSTKHKQKQGPGHGGSVCAKHLKFARCLISCVVIIVVLLSSP